MGGNSLSHCISGCACKANVTCFIDGYTSWLHYEISCVSMRMGCMQPILAGNTCRDLACMDASINLTYIRSGTRPSCARDGGLA